MNSEPKKGSAKATFDSKESADLVKNKMVTCTTRFKFYLPKVNGDSIEFGFGIESDCVNAADDFKTLFNSWLNKKSLATSSSEPCKKVDILTCAVVNNPLEYPMSQLQGDLYTIYIVSESANTETFWLFLDKPDKLAVGSTIYANSAANLTIASGSSPEATFGIPIQYKLGAKSSNKAVGLNVKVATSQLKDVNIQDVWKATFYDGPEHQAPDLDKADGVANKDEINYTDNSFNPDRVIQNSWYPSQTFGIQTENGFVGMTWEARPAKTVAIAPKLTFFVTTGEYSSNQLADYSTVSNSAQIVNLSDFSGFAVTVTYTKDGKWNIKKGRP
ncbi:TPA: hypothetical protein ACPZRY_002565 [Yersinia enterocolitica]|uniref:hypothetical protein n=1 Tax=Yersinia enterocolitica TaxID=630 RepID=UPI0032FE3B00|nr:hypothetical protein [Yersinia enterocolitica]EKN4808854.1 hypothetical protein [Yersinia enterocolitica]HDL7328564.1 hypothetical protein [Yersinia enterocolitica]HDL7356620.1 hypothetical protein [Yersinia enterocolitica]HDL7957372.1 hypothetical protein [Yersinia enterocolitica]